MPIDNRIPLLQEVSREAAAEWFRVLADRRLIFHPEDDPSSIVSIDSGTEFFTPDECKSINEVLDLLRNNIGNDQLIEVAYWPFMAAAGQVA